VANAHYRPPGDTGTEPPLHNIFPPIGTKLRLRRLPAGLGFQFGRAFFLRLKLEGQIIQPCC